MTLLRFHACDARASRLRSATLVSTDPTCARANARVSAARTRVRALLPSPPSPRARARFAARTVGVDSSMKETTPLRIEATDQAGTHVSGWKSLMERQRRVFVLNRPLRRRERADGSLGS